MAIIVNLWGGLGNQMFQYAFGRNLAIRNKSNLMLDANKINIPEYNLGHRNFLLPHFNINAQILTTDDIIEEINKPIDVDGEEGYKILQEDRNCFDGEKLEKKGNFYVKGYWQSVSYFSEIESIIRNELTLTNPIEKDKDEIAVNITNSNSVSIHVRRGDYLNPNIIHTFGVCSIDYYKQAIQFVANKIDNPTFFIFSDDIDWAMNNLDFIHFPKYFVINNHKSNSRDDSHEYLYLMSMCKHNIIANSTFSWWAAYLNKYFNKIIIAPKEWFISSHTHNADLIPKEWVRI